jgi:hypothetical protein
MTLSEKVEGIIEGDLLAFSSSDSFSGAGYLVEYVTEKAIKVDGDWIPKSQIIDIDLDISFNGGTLCKDVCLSPWFDKKLSSSRGKGYGF